ncbi:MAG: inositol monophosphatase family protein [Bacteroidota bacterium]
MDIELKAICASSCAIIEEVAQFIREELGKVNASDIETKALNSLVSYVDKTAEEQLVTQLKPLIPEATFLTEEETVEQENGTYRWIIDPLDGTTNFLHQIPFFAISVALQYREKTVIGIVYEVNRQECFSAWESGGCFLNGQPVHVSDTQVPQEALMATGFPYYDYSYMEGYLEVLRYLMLNTRGVRRLGAAALDLAYVACGRFDGFFEYSLSPWDVAAGAFLVQEAGGRVTDFQGGDDFVFGRSVIACNAGIFPEISAVVMGAFNPES